MNVPAGTIAKRNASQFYILAVAHIDQTRTHYAMGLLVSTTCFSNFAYQFAQKIRTPTVILFIVLFFLAAAIYLVLFLDRSLGLF